MVESGFWRFIRLSYRHLRAGLDSNQRPDNRNQGARPAFSKGRRGVNDRAYLERITERLGLAGNWFPKLTLVREPPCHCFSCTLIAFLTSEFGVSFP